MRKSFIETITKLATTNKNIYLLTADMGFGLVEPFANAHPDRFINVGVAEQNMIGIAAGLALSGKRVFCYSISNFPTLRCLEQIREDVCYPNLPVCIVAGNTGLVYGALGSSHHATEDIAIMRSLPNMIVVSPGDAEETGLAVRAIVKKGVPSYLRLTASQSNIAGGSHSYLLGRASTIFCGIDATLIATGGIISIVIRAAIMLRGCGIRARLLDMSTIKPLDREAVVAAAAETKAIVTVEEHSVIGGLGGAVAEVLAETRGHAPLRRLGIADKYQTTALSYDEMLKDNHLTAEDIVAEILDALR